MMKNPIDKLLPDIYIIYLVIKNGKIMKQYRKTLYDLMCRLHPADMANIDIKDFNRDMFYSPGGDSLRLRHYGLKFFEKYFDNYQVSAPATKSVDQIPVKYLVWLTQHCKSIYYVGTSRFVLFDPTEATLFQLLDGDLEALSNSGGLEN